MSLTRLGTQVVGRTSGVQRTYVEISRFFRTRHHGISPSLASRTKRCFTSSRALKSEIEPNQKLLDSLGSFRETLKQSLWEGVEPMKKDIRVAPVDEKIVTMGYLVTRRDISKTMSFANLHNPRQDVNIQLFSQGNVEGSPEAEALSRMRTLRDWTPVIVEGTLKKRNMPKKIDADDTQTCHTREIAVSKIVPLNEIDKDVIVKEEAVYGPEQRYLQLRTTPALLNNLRARKRAEQIARKYLDDRSWTEVETPLLFKSTPEGAREFLVPTRRKGFAYALPQSPQQYKQTLMASGIDKYFQFAKCFRDEDLRADRQPEFTQLDMEMAWAGEQEVKNVTEGLLRKVWAKMLHQRQATWTSLKYQEAMASYGSDKPDLRYPAKIHSITELVPEEFKSKISPLTNPAIDAFKLKFTDDPSQNRKFISNFLDSPAGKPFLNNPDGQPAIFFGDAAQPMGGLGPMGYQFTMESPEEVQTEHGDMLVVQARKNVAFQGEGSTMLGNLRLALYKEAIAQGLMEPEPENNRQFAFVWITDFPLFTPSTDADPGQGGAAGLSSTHHPFTAPKTAHDVDLLFTDPTKATAAHYDIVVNGIELGGGSRRIHSAEVQEFIFRDVLKMKPERIEDFRHLLDALRSGCPPHAGLALGWDRVVAVLRGTDSVRDVIAFPKTGSGEDAMVKAPNQPTEEQLATYHLRLKD